MTSLGFNHFETLPTHILRVTIDHMHFKCRNEIITVDSPIQFLMTPSSNNHISILILIISHIRCLFTICWEDGTSPVESSPVKVSGSFPAKKDLIKGLGPVLLRGRDRSGWVQSSYVVGIDPTEQRSYWGVGTGPVLGLEPIPLRDWNQSSSAEVLGLIPVKKDLIEGLGPVSLSGWDKSRGGVGTSRVGSNPTEVLQSIPAKRDHIEGLRPAQYMGWGVGIWVGGLGFVQLALVPQWCWDLSWSTKIILRGWDCSRIGVGTDPAEGLEPVQLGPIPLNCWDQSRPTEVLGSIPAKRDHIEGLGPVLLGCWDWSSWV